MMQYLTHIGKSFQCLVVSHVITARNWQLHAILSVNVLYLDLNPLFPQNDHEELHGKSLKEIITTISRYYPYTDLQEMTKWQLYNSQDLNWVPLKYKSIV